MADETWIDEFIMEVKKLAYDMPVPNPYTPVLLSHCLEAERRRLGEKYRIEDAKFRALCEFLNAPEIRSPEHSATPSGSSFRTGGDREAAH
jgi:hypothetical protein